MSYCTEKEASEKWCPFARVKTGQNREAYTVTGDVMFTGAHRCLGSACMMWQWFEASHQIKDQRRGICGLVLKPGPW